MPFSFKPTIPQAGNGTPGSSFSFGDGQDLKLRTTERGASLFEVVLYFLFCAACFVVALLFGYKYYLTSQIEKAKAHIERKEQELDKYPIEEMRRLSARIKVINQLTKEHPYVNAAFRILEDSVENQIMYKSFSLNSVQGRYTVNLQALSPDYKSIAQQVDTLKNLPYSVYISNVKVNALVPTSDGKVSFMLEMPMSITGTLPEDLNFSYGKASTTTEELQAETASSTLIVTPPSTSTSTNGTSTKPAVTR